MFFFVTLYADEILFFSDLYYLDYYCINTCSLVTFCENNL